MASDKLGTTALRPPEKLAHLRWHWIHTPSGDEPWMWVDDQWLPAGCRFPFDMTEYVGCRYLRPDDPNAITLDPGSVEQVEAVGRILALADRHDPDELSNPIAKEAPPTPWWKRYRNTAILGITALRDMKGAGG